MTPDEGFFTGPEACVPFSVIECVNVYPSPFYEALLAISLATRQIRS